MTNQREATLQPATMPERVASFAILLPKGIGAKCFEKREATATSPEADFETFAEHIAQQLAAAFGATLQTGEDAPEAQAEPVNTEQAKPYRSRMEPNCNNPGNYLTNFAFDLGQLVRLAETSETGIITGRAEHSYAANNYLVRYSDGNGCQTEQWWNEEAIRAT